MLTAWLEQVLLTELYLGDNWLRAQIDARRQDREANTDRAWAGLYWDNGSCLDIIVGAAQDRVVQVISTSPLAVSDGHTFISARLSRDCLRNLRNRRRGTPELDLHSLITVHAFTIRYSTYGPPGQKLQLVLDDIDWDPTRKDTTESLGRPQALVSQDAVDAALKRLHTTRATQEKDRTKRHGLETMGGSTSYNDEGDTGDTSMLESQVPFRTQAAQIRRQPRPTLLGPGNRDDVVQGRSAPPAPSLRPAGPITTPNQLLSLLDRPAPARQLENPTSEATAAAQPSVGRPSVAHHQSNRMPPGSTEQPFTTKIDHGLSQLSVQDDTHARAAQDNSCRDSPQPTQETDIFFTSADWLSGVDVAIASLPPSGEQQNIIIKNHSWAIPERHLRFPRPNIPVRILKELSEADMHDSAENDDTHYQDDDSMRIDSDQEVASCRSSAADPEEADEIDEPATSVMSWSPSPTPEPPKQQGRHENALPPDSSLPAASAESSTQAIKQPKPTCTIISLDEPSSSESEQGQSSTNRHNRGGVDSDDDMMEIGIPHGLGEDDETPGINHADERALHPPASPLKNTSIRPIVQVKETPYPKQKAGSSIAPPHHQTSSGSSKHTSSTSIIYGTYNKLDSSGEQVQKSTTNAEAISNVAKSPKQIQETHHISHDSDIEMEDVETVPNQRQGHLDPSRQKGPSRANIDQYRKELPPEHAPTSFQGPFGPVETNAGAVPPSSPPGASISNAGLVQSAPSNHLAAEVPRIKRKSDESPRKMNPRKSKRRAIKIISFGDSPASQVDPFETYRQQKEEFLRRDSARRLEAESANSLRAGSACVSPFTTDAPRSPTNVVETIFDSQPRTDNVDMSVQHSIEELGDTIGCSQTRDLYALPSPAKLGEPRPQPLKLDVESIQAESTRGDISPDSQHEHNHPGDEGDQEMQTAGFSDAIHQDARAPKPQSDDAQEYAPSHPSPLESQLPETQSRTNGNAHLPFDQHDALQQADREVESLKPQSPFPSSETNLRHLKTVFDRFKAVYPEYTGDRAHFLGQCQQIQELDREDKMVPRFQWDDYIIRNRSDFKDYAMLCIQSGSDPEPYHRFYKNRVSTVSHNEGIVEDAATLQMAIEELEGASSRIIQPKPARHSLPWQLDSVLATPARKSPSLMQRHPRHSLPGIFQHHRQSPAPDQEKASHTRTTELSAGSTSALTTPFSSSKNPGKTRKDFGKDGASESRHLFNESTGNKFRDFVKGQQKMASHTGQTSVSSSLSSKPPQVRESKPSGNAK